MAVTDVTFEFPWWLGRQGVSTGGYSTLYFGYLLPRCILGYMDTGYKCIADTTGLQYFFKGGIHACIHGYGRIHVSPGRRARYPL